MNTDKEKSAVGAGTPATEEDINNSSKNSISDGQEKIKMQKGPFGSYYDHPICRFWRQYLDNNKKLYLTTIAELLGVDRRHITDWRDGVRLPSVLNLIKLADYCGVTLDELCKGKGGNLNGRHD